MTDITQFSDFALKPTLLSALKEIGYEQPSPIQAQAIPSLLNGHDVLGMAQTGTGKTAAFALPVLNAMDLKKRHTQALILTPTRELAIQVAEAFQKYAHNLKDFHVLPIYGGQSMLSQLRALERGVHIVVGTPGRVMDHLRRKSLDLDGITHVVLDEADEMLRMGFIDDVEWILEQVPTDRQTALFSATMPKQIQKVAQTYLNNPVTIQIESKTTTVMNIDQQGWIVKGVNKLDALTRILEIEEYDGVIIFVRTKTATVELAEKLEARGHATSALNGDMNQALRERTVERLKNGKLDIVVATDVAARGIDVPRISHVINYDIPYDTESYVHRIGRTGRAGRNGKAILFVAPREQRMLQSIERATRQPITMMQLPSKEQITHHRINAFKQSIVDVLNTENLDFFSTLVAELCKEQQILPEDAAKALAFLAQKGNPLLIERKESEPEGDFKRERPERGEKPARGERKERGERREFTSDVPMTTYRIEVGREHGVMPKDIVGAIANEVQLNRDHIGHIRLFELFSTVELPTDLPRELIAHLKKVRVKSQRLDITVDTGPGKKSFEGGKFDKPKADKPKFNMFDDSKEERKPKRKAAAEAPAGKKPSPKAAEAETGKSPKGKRRSLSSSDWD
ncbi:MAG TPA: DEAD/DEAH box helicase [Cellvibrionaceae bacterium]|nr:DEAD/DEAH box helicase [Cellvibrionaceae bacterium]